MIDRHYLAWALARRVSRKGSRDPRAVHWAALGSVWLHLGALGLALLAVPIAVERPIETLLVVTRAEPHPADWRATAPVELAEVLPAEQVRVARTEAEDESPIPPDRWDAESRYDTVAEQLRRTPVSSDRAGPLLPLSDGASDEAGGRTPDRRAGDEEASSGNRPDGPDGPIVLGGGGGGHHGAGSAEGAPTVGGAATEGGPAGGRAGGPIPVHARSEALTPDRGADRAFATAAPPWWDPIATRIEVAPGSGEGATPGDARSGGEAVEDRLGRRISSGGQDRAHENPAIPTPAGRHPGTRRVAAPGTADPAEELRLALGFGPIDRSRLAPRPAWAGTLFGQGSADSSPQTTFEAPIDWSTHVSTRGTALGAWVLQAEAVVSERWRSMDLDPHARAVGISGDVTVRFTVRRDGTVADVHLVRSSGNPSLDDMATSAVPTRLPRFPRELGESAILQELTLRYRNPAVSIAPR